MHCKNALTELNLMLMLLSFARVYVDVVETVVYFDLLDTSVCFEIDSVAAYLLAFIDRD